MLSLAAGSVGIKEFPSGSNNVSFNTEFYGREVRDGYRLDGTPDKNAKYPWCGTSMSILFWRANLPLGVIDYKKGFAGCPYALKCIKDPVLSKTKKWGDIVTFEQAEPGDLIFFDWDLNSEPNHVGMLKSKNLTTKTMETYEGNTSFGNDSNGGCFMERNRKYFGGCVFVRPNALL